MRGRERVEREKGRGRERAQRLRHRALSLSQIPLLKTCWSLKKKKKKKQELSALGLAELVDEGPETPWDILIPSKIVREKKEEEF